MESWSAIGLMSRTDPVVQQRRTACWTCPYRANHGIGGSVAMLLARTLIDEPKDGPFIQSWCMQCRCYLPLKTRVRWGHCPLGYW
jgi:hypothetical protein